MQGENPTKNIFKNRSFFLSQLYFFFLLSAVFGFIDYLFTYQLAYNMPFVSAIHANSYFISLCFSIFFFYHISFYQYPFKPLFLLLSVFTILQQFLSFFLTLEYFKYMDYFEYRYEVLNPSILHKHVPSIIFKEKVILFAKLLILIFSYRYLYVRKIMVLPFSLNITTLSHLNFLKYLIRVVSISILLFLIVSEATTYLIQRGVLLSTGGFVSYIPEKGIYTKIKVYQLQKDNKTINVYLYPSMHIGPKEFYSSYDEMAPEKSVVLMEGVTDEKKKMDYSVNDIYSQRATEVGFIFQPPIPSQTIAEKKDIFYHPSDVDVSVFEGSTLELLKTIFQGISPKEDDKKHLTSKIDQEEVENNSLILKHFRDDIIVKRNDSVINNMNMLLDKTQYTNFIIPWGAEHMRGIEEMLVKNNYNLLKVENVLYLKNEDFFKILKIFQNISN